MQQQCTFLELAINSFDLLKNHNEITISQVKKNSLSNNSNLVLVMSGSCKSSFLDIPIIGTDCSRDVFITKKWETTQSFELFLQTIVSDISITDV